MRRVWLLTLLMLALPVMSWANSSTLVFSNNGGTMNSNGSLIQMTGSTLTSFSVNGNTYTGTLGSVSFSTGSLISGNLGSSGVFSAGGSFTIMSNGSNGLPSGALFTGSFSGPVNWVGTYNPAGDKGLGTWTYTLTGTVSGALSNGTVANGGTVQITFDVNGGKPFGKGVTVRANNGVTTVTVPEPGTLGLLGTGLIGLAGLMRRKMKR